MKRFTALVLILAVALLGCATAEDSLSRGKSFGVTKTEWLNRYAAVPILFVGNETPIYPVKLLEDDYRVYYVATPFQDVNVVLMCEDTTDYVVGAAITLEAYDLMDDYDLEEKIGKFIAEFVRRSALATNPNSSQDWISNELFAIIDTTVIREREGKAVEYTIDKDGFTYKFTYSDGSLFFGIRSAYSFESEEEFQQYRESTL